MYVVECDGEVSDRAVGLSGSRQYHDIRYSSLGWEDGSAALTLFCELRSKA